MVSGSRTADNFKFFFGGKFLVLSKIKSAIKSLGVIETDSPLQTYLVVDSIELFLLSFYLEG